MAHPFQINVTESIPELRRLQRNSSSLIAKRLLMLIEIKRHEKTGISKRELSKITGINHNSIVKWRNLYKKEGIEPLLTHGRIGGFKKSVISKEEHAKIEKKLNDPKNGIRGYTELLDWVKKELGKEIKYITLLKYTQRHFGSKIKVARKSHVKKDDVLVDTFKKTLVKNARK
ncbi:MAG: helix-turn-helix domain-containing protein [Ginsengibacter sp.]